MSSVAENEFEVKSVIDEFKNSLLEYSVDDEEEKDEGPKSSIIDIFPIKEE